MVRAVAGLSSPAWGPPDEATSPARRPRRRGAALGERAQHEIERRHGLPHGALTAAAFAPELLRPAILGTHDDATWRAAIADRLAVEHPRADARAAVAEWARSPGAADPAAVAFLDARRADHVICFVTNATSRLRADLAALDLLAHCDH